MTGPTKLPFGEPSTVGTTPTQRIFTVTEITAVIRTTLEMTYPEVLIEGEISNARVWKTGHLYFTLKDQGAQLNAVMFRSSLRSLRFKPENGQQVMARGRLSVYEPKGEYQIVCEHLEPQGLGTLQLAFQQVKERLEQEGLFHPSRKRSLPALPRKIGVVTSLDGAAIRDILNVLSRRQPNVHVVVSSTRVQGKGAAKEIVTGLEKLTRIPGVDVVIIARGGGSIEDLWAFNEESVARAIGATSIPIVSGIGHETDFTIADFVVDLRAPTPSAAAELVAARKDELIARTQRAKDHLRNAAAGNIQQRRSALHVIESRPGLAGWPTRVAGYGRNIADLTHRLNSATQSRIGLSLREIHLLRLRLEALSLDRQLSRIRAKSVRLDTRLTNGASTIHADLSERVRTAANRLQTLSPLAVLSRGYAVCWTENRSAIIREATAVKPGDSVTVTLHQGEIDCEVRSTK